MKRLLQTMLVAIPAFAVASVEQTTLPALCGKTLDVFKGLQSHGERMYWTGQEEGGTIVSLWTNETKKTYTILKTNKNRTVTCIIAAGSSFDKA